MRRLADWIVRPVTAWAVVVLTILLFIVSAFAATRVPHDDDVLAFLPKANPDVAAFYEINRRFGGLRVGLVGVEAPNVLDPAFFDALKQTTKALDESPNIDFALSLSNVDDFVVSPDGGIETDLLVRDIPKTEGERQALAAKVRSRDLVVGQLVSADLDAVLILAFPSEGTSPRAFAEEVHATTRAHLGGYALHFGGAPFVSSYVFETTQADLAKLTPWAVGVIVLLILLAFSDIIGAVVVLFSTAVGITASMALMFVFGVEHNIVLSSMPVIAFSVGSAYGLHVLARYQQLAREHPRDEALRETLIQVGPTVLTSGLTTVCGLLSFLAMDIAPMRTFGLFTGLGVFIALVLALTFVPAAIRVGNLTHPRRDDRSSRLLVTLIAFALERRAVFVGVVVLVAVTSASFVSRVDTRMDMSAFFAADSPPAEADRFLLDHFGGSQFIQVHLTGDFTDPATLWQLVHLGDRVEALQDVSAVQHIGQVLAQMNFAMEGTRRVPDSVEKTQLLYRFLAGRPAIGQLVLPTHDEAILIAKINKSDVDTVERVLHEVETIAADPLNVGARSIVEVHVMLATQRGEAAMSDTVRKGIREALARPVDPPVRAAVAQGVEKFLLSDESLVTLSTSAAARVAAVVVETEGPARHASVRKILESEPLDEAVDDLMVDDVVASIRTPLRESRRSSVASQFVDRMRRAIGTKTERPRWRAEVAGVVGLVDGASVTPKVPIQARVSGLPVLHRGLSRSTIHNQITSLWLALGSVLLVLIVAFRSVRLGLVTVVPTIVTLLVVYGGMGAMGVHLDIGTAMLASLIVGAGVDYAVHLVTAWRDEATMAEALAKTSTAILTNASMVAAGFFVLTLGEAKTLENVGHLTAAAMITAAISTFVCVPLLARYVRG